MNVRKQGIRTELQILAIFKKIFPYNFTTSRASNRLLDAHKVDIYADDFPFYIQVKKSRIKRSFVIKYVEVLDQMPKDKIPLLITKLTKLVDVKEREIDKYVTLKLIDFINILKPYIDASRNDKQNN